MPPQKIMVIRHAEKPIDGGAKGIDPQGAVNPRSLTVRGWQRAGALTRFFSAPPIATILAPDIIYAAGTGPGSPSRRPIDTAEPIAAKLGCSFVTKFLKEECDAVAADVMRQSGTVLIVWEHKMLPALIHAFPKAPTVPSRWPPYRFDVVWILDYENNGWLFTQLPQCLLAGDNPAPIL